MLHTYVSPAGSQSRGLKTSPGTLAIRLMARRAVVFIHAAAILLMDTAGTKASFAYGKSGAVAILKIKGNKVTKVGQVPACGLPEGVA